MAIEVRMSPIPRRDQYVERSRSSQEPQSQLRAAKDLKGNGIGQ